MSKTGLYVYAIVPSSADSGDTEGPINTELGTGLAGEAVRQVVAPGGLAAVVHACEPEPYQGPDSEVESWVLEHSQVIDRVWEAAGTVLPVSFNVIISAGEGDDTAESRLSEWLSGSAPSMREHLEKLRERVELRVEISLEEEIVTANSQELIDMREAADQRPAGVQRLYRKRFEERTREVAERLADHLYPDYRRRLAGLAEDLVENSRSGRTPGSVSVLTVSLLVPKDAVEAVGLELANIRDTQPGAQIRYLGPWPPYSFADIPEVSDSASTA